MNLVIMKSLLRTTIILSIKEKGKFNSIGFLQEREYQVKYKLHLAVYYVLLIERNVFFNSYLCIMPRAFWLNWLAPPDVYDIQTLNPPSPNYQIIKKKSCLCIIFFP